MIHNFQRNNPHIEINVFSIDGKKIYTKCSCGKFDYKLVPEKKDEQAHSQVKEA